jgi:uncharacterized protein (DUF952 family)
MTTLYKIVPAGLWDDAVAAGVFRGALIDLSDGFIHFSTADQVKETARLHFAGQDGLVLAAFDAQAFGVALRYEPSRGGALFPHLYGTLDPKTALWTKPLLLGGDGGHIFPALAP